MNSRPILDDSENDDDATEKRNAGKSTDTEDSDPLFPVDNPYLDPLYRANSNLGSLPLVPSAERVRLWGYA